MEAKPSEYILEARNGGSDFFRHKCSGCMFVKIVNIGFGQGRFATSCYESRIDFVVARRCRLIIHFPRNLWFAKLRLQAVEPTLHLSQIVRA